MVNTAQQLLLLVLLLVVCGNAFVSQTPGAVRASRPSQLRAVIDLEARDDAFQTEVLDSSFNQPVLVDMYAQWCGPCKLVEPLIKKVEEKYAGELKVRLAVNTSGYYQPPTHF